MERGQRAARDGATASGLRPWSATRTRPRRFAPGSLPPATAGRLTAALAREHARAPFSPADVRAAARRVVAVATALDLPAGVVRGGLDLGGAELDHVWVVVADHVIDISMPVRSEVFAALLRAYVAGDLEAEELDRAAHGYAIDWRVVGEFPDSYRYVGLPVFGQRAS